MFKKNSPDVTAAIAEDEKPVPKIIVDNKEYLINDLSQTAKDQLGSLRATDAEIVRLEALLAMLKTARNAYARAAKEELGT